jgi:hypothetical protein
MTETTQPIPGRPVCDYARDDQRQSTRFRKEPGTDFAAIWRAGCEAVLAEVYDESLTGICLVMADASGYPVGTKAELFYRSTPLVGEVRHVTPQPGGGFLVGLACQRSGS